MQADSAEAVLPLQRWGVITTLTLCCVVVTDAAATCRLMMLKNAAPTAKTPNGCRHGFPPLPCHSDRCCCNMQADGAGEMLPPRAKTPGKLPKQRPGSITAGPARQAGVEQSEGVPPLPSLAPGL